MATKIYGGILLTGGGTGALDSIDGNLLNDQDKALVATQSAFYFFSLDETSGASENSPYIIAPDTNPGNKRWILIDGFGQREVGKTAISTGTTSVTVSFSKNFSDTNYIVTCSLSNTDEGAGASKYAFIITAKTVSGFTVEFSDTIDSAENAPYLEWIAEQPI